MGRESKKRLKKKNTFIGKLLECIMLVAFFLIYILPFYYMLVSSLMSMYEVNRGTIVWWPEKLMWSNYLEVFQYVDFLHYGKNSIIISLSCVLACLITSVPCAYAFARLEFRFKKPLFAIVLSDMMIPAQCVVLPLFMIFAKLEWLNTYKSMIVIFMYSGSTIFFIRNAFMQVSNEVLEAARLDGASKLTEMFRILLPMVKPAVITMSLFSFLSKWNDYFWNLALTTNDHIRTLPYAVKQLNGISSDLFMRYDLSMAGMTILMAPTLVVYILASKKVKNAFVYTGIK